jgi:hypothetical protein
MPPIVLSVDRFVNIILFYRWGLPKGMCSLKIVVAFLFRFDNITLMLEAVKNLLTNN